MADSLNLKPIHPIATLLNHLRLIILLTIILTTTLAAVVLIRVKPVFGSFAALEVTLLHSRLLAWDPEKQFSSRSQYTDYINTQVKYLVGHENVRDAIRKLDLPNKALTPGGNETETVFRYQRKINAQSVRNTHLITISASDTQPEDLDTLVNALVDAYMERQQANELGKNDNRIQHLQKELVARQQELQEENDRLTRFTLELGAMNINQEVSPHDQVLSSLRDALTQASIDRISAEHHYNAQIEAVEKQRSMGVAPMVEEYIYQDLNTVDMKNRTFQFREELNRQATYLKPNHPNNKQLQKQMEASQEYLEESLQDSRTKANRIVAGKMEIDHQKVLSEAKALYVAARNSEEDILKRYNKEKAQLNKFIPIYQQAKQVNSSIDRLRSRITQIETRLDELIIEAKAPGRLKIQSAAREPIYPSKDRRKIFLALALVFSFCVSVLVAFAIDYFTPTIIDPQHMAQIIGTRPTGVLTHWDKGPDFGQLMYTASSSFHADQFRRILPRIFPASTSKEHKTYAVLSIVEGHGAMSFALNVTAALETGGRSCGLLEVTNGHARLPERVENWELETRQLDEETGPGLPLSCKAGKYSQLYYFHEPCSKESMSDQVKLGQLLNNLAARTGALIVTGPPLFQHSEAELLCRQADVVVLVINGPKTSPGELKRAMAILKELKVKECAVIANDLPVLPGGYFTKARADYEGRELKYPLLKDVMDAVWRAIPFIPQRKNHMRG